MEQVRVDFPTQARIKEGKWRRYSLSFANLGLPKPEFRAIRLEGSRVIVDPADLSKSVDGPFSVGLDLVEFVES
ncbi:MAG: hypothetical protein A3A26_02035 [Candidatus Zambryskibacteria bacterium RIFCSPLOWO2_01_FULL_47_14]|uniref:Uncharacterized protein n=1 Tax=Candidatus Zambryskibacteria bacterium RIFCSPLOWO2_01_FULL_47_14 TaxID=1802763 RepID=A0A1G2U775_9BACT|nr:MAG: hypothetical protein A3A26_02035 [Candidatus Zambryskibacteria bacterium RIFCSPLOWO2_01_FULL_47_14]